MAEAAWKTAPLTANSGLQIGREEIGDLTIGEVADLSILTIASTIDGFDTIGEKVRCDIPFAALQVGSSTEGTIAADADQVPVQCRFAMLQPGQLWVLSQTPPGELMRWCRDSFESNCWLTDQSDGWVALRVSGESAQGAEAMAAMMARLSMLDFSTMPLGAATRTLMAHMGVIVIKEADDRMLVLGARSTAEDLVEAVIRAARGARQGG